MKTQDVQAKASRASESRGAANKSAQRHEPGGGSYKSQLKAKEKLGAAAPRDKQMPEQLKGNQVRERA